MSDKKLEENVIPDDEESGEDDDLGKYMIDDDDEDITPAHNFPPQQNTPTPDPEAEEFTAAELRKVNCNDGHLISPVLLNKIWALEDY